jgi:hypothetical protein
MSAPLLFCVLFLSPILFEDTKVPELDLNNITLTTVPTNSSAPNGETMVKIRYYARDHRSGLGLVYLCLLGPQGESFGDDHHHENLYSFFFQGNPTVWTMYETTMILPAGISPGHWGLSEIYLEDKAGNFSRYNLLEILTFEISD